MTNIAMEYHHFQCEYSRFQWPFSMAMLVYQRLIMVDPRESQAWTFMRSLIGNTIRFTAGILNYRMLCERFEHFERHLPFHRSPRFPVVLLVFLTIFGGRFAVVTKNQALDAEIHNLCGSDAGETEEVSMKDRNYMKL